jgi:hypothetical protein
MSSLSSKSTLKKSLVLILRDWCGHLLLSKVEEHGFWDGDPTILNF